MHIAGSGAILTKSRACCYVMCTVIPRAAVMAGNPSLASGLIPLHDFTESEYFRFPRDEPLGMAFLSVSGGEDAWPYFGPNSACAGVQVKGVRFEPSRS